MIKPDPAEFFRRFGRVVKQFVGKIKTNLANKKSKSIGTGVIAVALLVIAVPFLPNISRNVDSPSVLEEQASELTEEQLASEIALQLDGGLNRSGSELVDENSSTGTFSRSDADSPYLKKAALALSLTEPTATTTTVEATTTVAPTTTVETVAPTTAAPTTVATAAPTTAAPTTAAPTTEATTAAPTTAATTAASSSHPNGDPVYAYSLRDLQFHGVINWRGYKFTYYSQSVLPGNGLSIPGRHVNADGYVADGNGYIVLANSAPNGTVIPTPFGYWGKVYDSGTYGNHFDVYTR